MSNVVLLATHRDQRRAAPAKVPALTVEGVNAFAAQHLYLPAVVAENAREWRGLPGLTKQVREMLSLCE